MDIMDPRRFRRPTHPHLVFPLRLSQLRGSGTLSAQGGVRGVWAWASGTDVYDHELGERNAGHVTEIEGKPHTSQAPKVRVDRGARVGRGVRDAEV